MYGVIYKLVSNIDGRIYVGQSIDFQQRIYRYKKSQKYPNKNSKIELAISRYKFENFHYYIIDISETLEMLDYKERFWIRVYSSDVPGIGFNIESGGNGRGKVSQETKDKISKALKGRFVSQETKDRISQSKTGSKASEATKVNMSKAQIERNQNMSEENKIKRSENMKGEKNPFYGKKISAEHKKRLLEINLGSIHAEEHNRKISQAVSGEKNPMFGKKHKEESLIKMRGENNSSSTLTWKDVNEIRGNIDNLSRKQLVAKYNVKEGTISRIINNKRWVV